MHRHPSIRPQEGPRDLPKGSVPREGKEPHRDRVEAGKTLRNPVKPTAGSIENGRRLYDIYCALCHGPDGKGDVPLSRKFIPPPDLTLDFFRDRPDGFIYETIRQGGALMPGQGDALSVRERWDIVNYLRKIQGATR